MRLTLENYRTIEMTDLITIVREANIIANKLYQKYLEDDELDINQKQDPHYISPVTNADLVVNSYLIDRLTYLSPEIPIMSEENKEIPYLIRKENQLYWCLDPIDGTKEFINKTGEFTINVGLVYKNKSILGVVGYPVGDIIYYAIKDQGAYMIKKNLTHKLKVRPQSIPPTIICSRSHMNKDTEKFLEKYKHYQRLDRGSSLKFMAIASGEADIYPRLVGCMEWDTCASDIIVTEAGGRIILASDVNSTLSYNKPDLVNPYFIVYGK